MVLVCCITPPVRLEHARVLHVLHYTVPALMSTRLLYVATLILTSCTMFFHFSEYRGSPNIRLNVENTISTSHLLPYPAFFFHSSRRRLFSSFDIFHTRLSADPPSCSMTAIPHASQVPFPRPLEFTPILMRESTPRSLHRICNKPSCNQDRGLCQKMRNRDRIALFDFAEGQDTNYRHGI